MQDPATGSHFTEEALTTMNSTMQSKPKPNLNIKQRFSFGVGNVLNDIFRQLYISFTIVFLMQVVGLPPSKAGLVLLIGQSTDAFISPISGYLGDRVRIPFISKKMGCRKSWHLVGTILMAVTLPLMFNQCLPCSQYQDVSWLPLVYYTCLVVAVSTAYNLVEINHLSIIITAAETIEEGTAVNAIRTVFSFLSGIYVYVVAWGLLGQDSGEGLGPESVTQFARLTWITTGTGVIFVIVFYIGTKEPTLRPLKNINSLMDPVNVKGLLKGGQSVYVDDIISQVEKLDQNRKKSLVMRFIDGLVHMTHQNQPETSVVIAEEGQVKYDEESENQGADEGEDEPKCSACSNDSNELEKMNEMNEHSESTDAGDNERDATTSRNSRQRKRGLSLTPEGCHHLGIFNLGYQNENIGTEITEVQDDESFEHCCHVEVHFEVQMPSLTKTGNSRKISFVDQKQQELEIVDEEKDSIGVVSSPAINAFEIEVETLSEKDRKVWLDEKERGSVGTGTEEDSTDITCKPEKRRPMTTRDWLMNPRVYKVAAIVTCSRLVQDAVYAYLPLYLTERLGLGKQSIAYFPLVLLVSAALGSTLSDKLNKKIGSKWTYILASVLVIGSCVYCYLQTPSLKQSTYAPIILIGSGMSIMYVMALAFITELIGDDKETSGSVMAIIVFIGRISSGSLFMAIQEFYPDNDSESNASSDYVRHVFSMVPAILALASSLMVLFSQSSSLCSTRKEYSPNEEATVQAESNTSSFDVVVIPEKKASCLS